MPVVASAPGAIPPPQSCRVVAGAGNKTHPKKTRTGRLRRGSGGSRGSRPCGWRTCGTPSPSWSSASPGRFIVGVCLGVWLLALEVGRSASRSFVRSTMGGVGCLPACLPAASLLRSKRPPALAPAQSNQPHTHIHIHTPHPIRTTTSIKINPP